MRTTLNIDDALIKKASQLTGVKEKNYLVRMGLQSLISQESGWLNLAEQRKIFNQVHEEEYKVKNLAQSS